MNANVVKVLSYVATGLGLAGSVLGNYVANKQMKVEIAKAVAEAVAKQK